jgi:hypothetical protein
MSTSDVEDSRKPPVRSPRSALSRFSRWIIHNNPLHAAVVIALVVALVMLTTTFGARLQEIEIRHARGSDAIAARAADALDRETASSLRLTALPLGWALRGALLQNQLADAETYLRRMIQEPQVTRAMLLDPKGTVWLAPDGTGVGQPATALLADARLDAPEPTLLRRPAETLVVVPIMGFDRRLGTLIFGYRRSLDSEGGAPPPAASVLDAGPT